MAQDGARPLQLGANRRLNDRDLQRLYANPNSGGFLLMCLPVFGLSVAKAALGALIAGLGVGAVALWLALRSLPSNLCRAASTAWRTRYLGCISRAATLLFVLPVAVLAWPLALLVMGFAQGAGEAGRLLFDRTSDSLQPAGQHSFMFVENPFAAGVGMAVAELRCLVSKFVHLCERDLPAWLDKHVPPPSSPSALASKASSAASTGQPAGDGAKAVAAGDVEQQAASKANADGSSELSIEARVARGVVAALVAVLGGLVGAIGMLALGVRHTGKVSVFVWRQLARWAWVGPTAPPAQEGGNGAPDAGTTTGKGGAVGMLASAASLPQKVQGGGVRLSMSSVTSVDSQGLASVAEEDEEKEAGKHLNKQQQGQQQPGPQRSSGSGSSNGDGEPAPQCTATLASAGGGDNNSGDDKAAAAAGAGADVPTKCTPLACLRWVVVLPLFPFVPLAVLGFVLLASLTWLLGGALLSLEGAWRATTWSGVLAGGLAPVVDALESLHLSVLGTCAKAARGNNGNGTAAAKRSPISRAAGRAEPPRMPQPAQHLAINITNEPAAKTEEQQ